MKKLLLSAFAMSLIVSLPELRAQTEGVDDFLGLESEILPELQGKQRFTPGSLHGEKSWQVSEESVEQDADGPNKGQGYSIIPWSTQDPDEWLSIDKWIREREVKDQIPDWKVRLRADRHQELAGKILQCKGECFIYRGTDKARVTHLSQVKEGDEVVTKKGSVAWVFLIDGTIVRLSPETSLSLIEFNLGKSEFFVQARLNQGHIYWHGRDKNEFILDRAPETDSHSLPLMVREANLEFFEREIYQRSGDQKRLSEVMDLEENAVAAQVSKLNELRLAHNPKLTLGTRVMLVAPNSTVVARGSSFDYLYVPGGKSFLNKRSPSESEFAVHLRGYSSSETQGVSPSRWYEVDPSGRSFVALENAPGTLQVIELLTRRIRSIELAREIWIRDFTLPLMDVRNDPRAAARLFGYTTWEDDSEKRFQFLVEYTRRIETTNLRSIENLLSKLESKGTKQNTELTDEQIQASLNHYLLGLKNRYHKNRTRVRDMNDLHYYVWILKNGKF